MVLWDPVLPFNSVVIPCDSSVKYSWLYSFYNVSPVSLMNFSHVLVGWDIFVCLVTGPGISRVIEYD